MRLTFPITVGSVTIFGTPIAECTHHTRRQAEKAAVDSLLQQAFGTGTQLAHTPAGSPYIPGSHTHISISHGAGMALLAVSPSGPIGIDIECWREQLLRVTHKYLTHTEQTAFGTDPALLLRAWTSKEAVYKAASTPGLPLTDISLPLTDNVAEAKLAGIALTFTLHHFTEFPVTVTLAQRKIG